MLLIRGGRVVRLKAPRRPERARRRRAASRQWGRGLLPQGARVVDAAGRSCCPGHRPHVHMALPVGLALRLRRLRSGSRAALAGGTTTLIDFATPAPGQSSWRPWRPHGRGCCVAAATGPCTRA